ncbi:MAG: hypothetical protein ACWIPI_10090 [Polaribacter sp.]
MSTKIDVNQFKNGFCDTLQKDKEGSYFKVYVDDYQHLALYNYYLTKSIHYITQSMELHNDLKEFQDVAYSINYLTQLIEAINLLAECEGIDRLIK